MDPTVVFALVISAVVLFCLAVVLLIHWFGALPVLTIPIVVLTALMLVQNRVWILAFFREQQRRHTERRERSRPMREAKQRARGERKKTRVLARAERRRSRTEKRNARILAGKAGFATGQERTRTISESVKREVHRRDQGRCRICGSNEFIEYDHIVPFSKGGPNTARNIQILCQTCNRRKGAKIL